MLGSQAEDGQLIPAQIESASEISHPSDVIVSIGADDLQWSAILQVCSKIRTLSTWLNALNQVLAKGAALFSFLSPQPSFAGHQLCSQQPYVQGLTARAPFHPHR
jgi:hypothetical protein